VTITTGLAEVVDARAQQGEDLRARLAVQVPGRLVGEHDVGPGHQCPGHGHALLLSAGQLRRPVVQAVGDAERAHDAVEPVGIDAGARQLQRQQDVLLRGHRGQQVEGLEDEADPLPTQHGQLTVGQAAQRRVAEPDLS
jgi:hypothetical protein